MKERELINAAVAAMKKAYSPYSGFCVGAALLCESGAVYTGCNVENASYGASNCAERTAVFKAVSEGEREFAAIAIVGGKGGKITDFCPPCGICRQVLSEFAGAGFRVLLFDGENAKTLLLSELLPHFFAKNNLE
ncbi:MAG: cytidine deaminase [Clostridia bacterium]|nr:cytidine deaminase [Clostridia bacterium]